MHADTVVYHIPIPTAYFINKTTFMHYYDIYIYYFYQIELAVAAAFLFDWCVMYFIADHKGEFLKSFYSMIDIATIIPTAFTYGTICPYPTELVTSHDILVYTMNAASTMRVLRILRVQRYFSMFEDPVKKFFAEMTESYVGVNDFYPFVRAELQEHDPKTYALMEKIWGKF